MNVARILIVAIVVCALLFAVGSILAVAGQSGLLDILTLQARTEFALAEADKAESEAKILDAKADIVQAQAVVIQAEAESKLYEAAASSVRKDSRLVAWYAVRSDVIALVIAIVSVPAQVAIGIIAGTELYKRYTARKKA